MGVTLDALHGLQHIERQIATIRAQADAKRRRVRVHQRSLQKQDALIEDETAAIRDRQMEIDRSDLDVKTRDEIIAKHREALNRTKTNKEYAAILTTINTEKADASKLESHQLQMMTQLDDQRIELQGRQEEREQIAQRVAAAEADLKQYLDANADDTQRLEQQRDQASQGIMAPILATFRRVAEKHEGQAMAEVSVLNAKRNEHVCGGCNMALTLEAVLMLRARDDIQMCVSCGKILYLEQTNESGARKR